MLALIFFREIKYPLLHILIGINTIENIKYHYSIYINKWYSWQK